MNGASGIQMLNDLSESGRTKVAEKRLSNEIQLTATPLFKHIQISVIILFPFFMMNKRFLKKIYQSLFS